MVFVVWNEIRPIVSPWFETGEGKKKLSSPHKQVGADNIKLSFEDTAENCPKKPSGGIVGSPSLVGRGGN